MTRDFTLVRFFRGLGPAAVELKVHPVAHHRLIAAPAERHLHGKPGIFVEIHHTVDILADADGQGRMRALSYLDVPDGIQHGEFSSTKW